MDMEDGVEYLNPQNVEDRVKLVNLSRRAIEEQNEFFNNPENQQEHLGFIELNYLDLTPYEILKSARVYNIVTRVLGLKQLGHDFTDRIAFYNFLYSQIESLMKFDDTHQFAAFITKYYDHLVDFTAQELFDLLVDNTAVGCLTALLESKLRSHVDVNKAIGTTADFAIDIAAKNHSSRMVTLLLRHGADPDETQLECLRGGIPLHSAMEYFRCQYCMFDWNPGKPIVELFSVICSPEMKQRLDTVRVLASHSKRVEDLCVGYIADGNLIHFAILLTAASDKLLLHLDRGLKNTSVGQYIYGELKSEANQLCERTSNLTSSSKIKSVVDAYYVLKTFCLIHGLIERGNESALEGLPKCMSPLDILCEFDTAVDKDNIECFLSKLNLEARELSQKHYGSIVRAISGKQRMGMEVGSIAEYSTLSLGSNSSYQASGTRQDVHFNHPKLVETRLSKCALVKPSSHSSAVLRKVASVMWFMRSIK